MHDDGVVFLYDHFHPLNVFTIPLHDHFCFQSETTCRVIRGQRISGVLKNLRERALSIRKYRQRHSRTRAYVIFGNQIESYEQKVYTEYLHLYYAELYDMGLDPCFVHILPEGYHETCENTELVEHHKKVSFSFLQVTKDYDTFNIYLTKDDLCGTPWQGSWGDKALEVISQSLLFEYNSWRNYD